MSSGGTRKLAPWSSLKKYRDPVKAHSSAREGDVKTDRTGAPAASMFGSVTYGKWPLPHRPRRNPFCVATSTQILSACDESMASAITESSPPAGGVSVSMRQTTFQRQEYDSLYEYDSVR